MVYKKDLHKDKFLGQNLYFLGKKEFFYKIRLRELFVLDQSGILVD